MDGATGNCLASGMRKWMDLARFTTLSDGAVALPSAAGVLL